MSQIMHLNDLAPEIQEEHSPGHSSKALAPEFSLFCVI